MKGESEMKCYECELENDCQLKITANDITGCDGHGRQKPPKPGMVSCMCCGNWVDKNKTFSHKNGRDYLCFDCY